MYVASGRCYELRPRFLLYDNIDSKYKCRTQQDCCTNIMLEVTKMSFDEIFGLTAVVFEWEMVKEGIPPGT